MSNELVPYSVQELQQMVSKNALPEEITKVTLDSVKEREQQRMLATIKAYLDFISVVKPTETVGEEEQQRYNMNLKAVNHLEQELWIWEYKRAREMGYPTQQELEFDPNHKSYEGSIFTAESQADKAVLALQRAAPTYVVLPQGKEEW